MGWSRKKIGGSGEEGRLGPASGEAKLQNDP